MAENQSGRENNNDDLDLVKLVDSAFSFIRSYGSVIVAFATAGILCGYILFRVLAKQYASTLLLHTFMLTNTEQINIIENWNTLLKDTNYITLGERWHCSPQTVKKVVKISAAEIQKLYIPNNPNGFEVTAIVKDNNILDSLGRGIVYGLENSDYVKARLSARRATLREMTEKVKIEITKLDSTKRNIESSITNKKKYSSAVIIDASTVNTQMIALNEKLLGYGDELKFSGAVQVLHPFEKFEKPVSPKFLKCIVLGLAGGLFIGYLVSLFNYFRKRYLLLKPPLHSLRVPVNFYGNKPVPRKA